MIDLTNKREVFWDDFIIDTEKTTALRKLGRVDKKELVLVHNKPWEGDGCDYHNIVFYNNRYIMYYMTQKMVDNKGDLLCNADEVMVCYAESVDGINWIKPELGLIEYNGNKQNNIIFKRNQPGSTTTLDNFYVFIDDNPDCPKNNKLKAVMSWMETGWERACLAMLVSNDGIHWNKIGEITRMGTFDTLNTCHYSTVLKKYFCYIRDFNNPKGLSDEELAILPQEYKTRVIKVLESIDCVNWSIPKQIQFDDDKEFALYTNLVQRYSRAPQIMIGFPTRYVDRGKWSSNYERLPGLEFRKKRAEKNLRYGTAITDCLFMCSRDGYNFKKYNQAFISPGIENGANWVYGDAYPSAGLLELPIGEDQDCLYSFYVPEKHWMGVPAELYRYTVRKDGFACMFAENKEKIVFTKPFIFEGKKLFVNFASSAWGHLEVNIVNLKSGEKIQSIEEFGNSIDRMVDFCGDIGLFCGKEVVLEIKLLDCEIYSFRFE